MSCEGLENALDSYRASLLDRSLRLSEYMPALLVILRCFSDCPAFLSLRILPPRTPLLSCQNICQDCVWDTLFPDPILGSCNLTIYYFYISLYFGGLVELTKQQQTLTLIGLNIYWWKYFHFKKWVRWDSCEGQGTM